MVSSLPTSSLSQLVLRNVGGPLALVFATSGPPLEAAAAADGDMSTDAAEWLLLVLPLPSFEAAAAAAVRSPSSP